MCPMCPMPQPGGGVKIYNLARGPATPQRVRVRGFWHLPPFLGLAILWHLVLPRRCVRCRVLFKDRIRELRRVPASALRPNPKNWRTHPKAQREALQGVLAEIGYADALLARELEDGSLELIDGHLRAETTPDQEVPVLLLDVTEDEAAKLLATLDPLAAMAGASAEQYARLIADFGDTNEAVAALLERTARAAGIDAAAMIDEDEAPAVRPDPVSRLGDLWLLGEHRLRCGD